ncbi:hypothetical protein G7Y89_g11314 [Cudoniella acicularis]|uniref:Transcription factor domain-containing protein n=1 Tax=Cudoniella acicularis TaxID=354080 RepID=A0A8H4RC64_9HELO|nr:hypothetical protein G7Y89_g11314 [Cudoniella acicularis]
MQSREAHLSSPHEIGTQRPEVVLQGHPHHLRLQVLKVHSPIQEAAQQLHTVEIDESRFTRCLFCRDIHSGARRKRANVLVVEDKEAGKVEAQCFHAESPSFTLWTVSNAISSTTARWSIVMVACRRSKLHPRLLQHLGPDFNKLLWATISEMPQSYHVVKALCLVCFWPLPTNNNFQDPTFQLSGMMVQIAQQNMLHLGFRTEVPFGDQPAHTEQRDRMLTWVACNIVAQSSSSIHGLPPRTNYGWVLSSDLMFLTPYQLPKDLVDQLRVSQFCNMTTALYCCNSLNGLPPENERWAMVCTLDKVKFLGESGAEISRYREDSFLDLNFLAAKFQLHTFAFFLPLGSIQRDNGFQLLYQYACDFLQRVMDYEMSTGTLLEHCSIFISQSIFSSIFALVKLLNSPFAERIDRQHGKAIFNGILLAIRRISLQNDDLPSRVAIRVPLLWKAMGAGSPWSGTRPDPLILKVDFRMGASHAFDCMWAWREHIKNMDGGSQTEQHKSPGPPSLVPSTSISAIPDASFQNPIGVGDPSLAGWDMNFDLFGAMDWMIDGSAGMDLPAPDFIPQADRP